MALPTTISIPGVALFFLLAIGACGTPTAPTSSPATAASETLTFNDWLHRYAAATPYASWNKTVSHAIEEGAVRSILNGEKRIVLNKPIPKGQKEHRELPIEDSDLKWWSKYREEEIINMKYKGRNDHLFLTLRNIKKEAAKKTDRLYIAIIGQGHLTDYFLRTADREINFAMTPFSLTSKFATDDALEFLSIIQRKGDIPESGGSIMLKLVASMYYEILWYARNDRLLVKHDDFFKPNAPVKSNVLFIGDVHYLRDRSIADLFPDAESLHNSGYRGIDVYFENHKTGALSFDSLLERADFSVYLRSRNIEEQMSKTPGLKRLIAGKNLITDPLARAWAERLSKLSKSQLDVRIYGVEKEP